jgi:hypothetical protein
MDADPVDLLLGKLEGVRSRGGYWMARCPAHEDREASLSVARGTEQPVVFKCHAGCDRDAILAAAGLDLADISNPRDEREKGEWSPHGEVVATYDYTDEHGMLLFQVCRTVRKQFPQRALGPDGKWQWRLSGVRRIPYRLPRLISAVSAGQLVYIVEGEKDVHAIEHAGGVATTAPGGAGKWRRDYDTWFGGADVIIVADRDEPGRKHAADVAAHLRRVAKSVRIAEAAEGKDAYDHLTAGHGLDEFEAASGDQPRYAAIAANYAAVDWAEAWNVQQLQTDWLFEPVLEAGTVNALFAKPGTGKSLLSLEIALRLVRQGHVIVYVDDENRVADLVERLQKMGAEPGELANLRLYSFAGLPPLDTPGGGLHLEALAVTDGASLVVLDTTSRMVQGKENDSDTFLQLYRCSLVPLKARGITVLRLDHPGKDESRGQRGSSAKDGDVDTIWRLTEESPVMFHLERVKSRSSHGEHAVTLRRTGPPLRHEWSNGGPEDMSELSVQVLNVLNEKNVPVQAGRITCAKIVREAGIRIGNAQLQGIINQRKTCPGQVAASADNSASVNLSAAPTPVGGGADRWTAPAPAPGPCAACGLPLDAALAAAGITMHPMCEDE